MKITIEGTKDELDSILKQISAPTHFEITYPTYPFIPYNPLPVTYSATTSATSID